ncbi:efflux transporter, RND family, MFP subunit [Carnobacterium sp. AT7]|uniref:efflux RND transporter periplasmic adaptor subunit n=1 Tax=Carnobacterium TaxID=2747 RepID=UPI00015F2BBC|nr:MULTISPECIES: HlyD family efflux transporter periplasmic adaptor subunit [Carnobacterium]EDP68871.1 efflux transporter, RND family, MFP subunit [Carnobacterium sp. AT7]
MNWKKGIGIIIAIAVIIFIVYSVVNSNSEEETINVQTAKVTQETIKETLSTTGIIESTQTQAIFGQGFVQDVPVNVGDSIEEGDRLISYSDGTTQTADFSGTVTTVNAKNDQVDLSSQTGEPAIVIADLTDLQVTINLSKSDAPLVEKGQTVVLTTGEESFNGTVSHIDPVASTTTSQTGTLTAVKSIISFDTPPENLFVGFDIDVAINTNTAENVLAIPIEALLYNEDNKPYVYVVENGKAIVRQIETGIQSSTHVEVKDGLELDDSIILSPDDTINDGTLVTSK